MRTGIRDSGVFPVVIKWPQKHQGSVCGHMKTQRKAQLALSAPFVVCVLKEFTQREPLVCLVGVEILRRHSEMWWEWR